MRKILFCILVMLVIFTGCAHFDNGPVTLSAGSISFDMCYVPGKTFYTGTNDSGSSTVSKAYWIARTEVTYELWDAVYIWATSNGYNFANPGRKGDGEGDTDQHPVTEINWRDAMVWCNALTEYYNALFG